MKYYEASIMIDNSLRVLKFKIKGNPIEYLWGRYGMDSYIEYIKELDEE